MSTTVTLVIDYNARQKVYSPAGEGDGEGRGEGEGEGEGEVDCAPGTHCQ